MKLSEAVKLLCESGIENPKFDAKEIFMHFGKFTRLDLIGDVDSTSEEIASAVRARAEHKPLQYILGEVGFFRETYKVNENCLIPRADTEILVEYAVKHLPRGAHFLDLCTGSGCVAISTLKNTENTTAVAVDISKAALSTAEENARLNGVFDRITLRAEDVLVSPLADECFAVLANPPYVSDTAYAGLMPEIYFEPKIAFVGKNNGLEFYERLTELYKNVISDNGFIAYEIGFDQADALINIAKKHGMRAEIIKDYSDNDRVCVLRK